MNRITSQNADPADIRKLKSLIDSSTRIVVLCHQAPDGDAVGSSLALANVVKNMQKHVCVITPDAPQKSLMKLPHAREILVASHKTEAAQYFISAADLIVLLDLNDLKRVDRVAPLVEASKAPRIVIDHHEGPDIKADLIFSSPASSSTCELLYELLEAAGLTEHLDSEGATDIYCGMMTDTGNFSYNSNNPRLYHIIASLIERGIDKDDIYKKVWNVSSASRLRLCGHALSSNMELLPELHGAILSLSCDDLTTRGYVRGDTEGLVNQPLAIPGIVWSVFLREDEPGYIKVSMRSQGDFDVNEICRTCFGGGGHVNAAGGELRDSTLEEAINKIKKVMNDNSHLLPADLPRVIDNKIQK